MTRATVSSRATGILVGANVLMALVVSAQLLLPAQPSIAAAAATDDSEATLPDFGDTTITAPPVSQFVDMAERPLFYADRRTPEPAPEEAPPPPTPLKLKLEGIAIAGGSRVAVLRNLNGNGLVQLVEGESHQGWTLDSLSAVGAVFSRNGEQRTELPLEPAGKGNRR